MFLDNKKVIGILNEIYSNISSRGANSQFILPDKEIILDKLNKREVVLFYYLKSMSGGTDYDGMPQVNMVLETFHIYPFGKKLWSTDPILRMLGFSNYLIEQDVCDKIIDGEYNKYIQNNIGTNYEKKDWDSFVIFLNEVRLVKLAR